jgi:hypothetical protein
MNSSFEMRKPDPHEAIQASGMAESICADLISHYEEWIRRIAAAQQSGDCPLCEPQCLMLAGALTFAVAALRNGKSTIDRHQFLTMCAAQWDGTPEKDKH